ncbi:MAG TPA: PBP1A family penicillin-binding protein [Thermoanaerobaculia bacterium]|nr:PBP1A family penicillin-binding protein [Thermoanaerobaculia bacterium]
MPRRRQRDEGRRVGVGEVLRSRKARLVLLAVFVVLVAVGAWLIQPFWQLSGQFADQPVRQPSRLYAQPTTLAVGERLEPDAVVEELRILGYRPAPDGAPPPGTYHRGQGSLVVHLRRFPTPKGPGGGVVLEIGHNGRRVERLVLAGSPVERAWLEPVLLASYYSDQLEERRPVLVDEVPEHLIEAVLAAEDANFFHHGGISPTGIARAAWRNLRGGEVSQGGSTLTQQLVKNLYLTHERTFSRKAREAVLAVLLEARYSKRQILQAYFNEIYMGASNGVNLLGLGAAARAYFGKDVTELDLNEAATLAGIIQSPASYDPTVHPEAARERRDWVLGRMIEVGLADERDAAVAVAAEVPVDPRPLPRRRAPYFAEMVRRELAERHGVEALEDAGYQVLSTVDWRDQQKAQEAVEWGVEALEEGWEKNHAGDAPLQAALVSVDPDTGGILAYVGGRNYGGSQFDRLGQAMRQPGSAFKPVVYAAAFETGAATPASFLEDAPLTLRLAGTRPWSPQNSDRSFRGWVTARAALEDSLNVPTARLALDTGLDRVVATARALGVDAPLQPVPSIALGAFELTPLELAQVYATFAAGGEKPPLHAVDAVLDVEGQPLAGRRLPPPQQVIAPETAYLVTSVLQGVLDRGTAASARRQGVQGPLAGKTGTTNSRRDSWFAGYSPDRTTVVWVGYDDNSRTNLSGTRAAVPIWSRFAVAVRPPGGYRNFDQPPGVVTAVIDPTTGLLATDLCPRRITEVFPRGQVPDRVCHVHQRYQWPWDERRGGYRDGDEVADGRDGRRDGSLPEVIRGEDLDRAEEPAAAAEPEREERRRGGVRGFFRRIFGGDEEDRDRDGGNEEGGDGG